MAPLNRFIVLLFVLLLVYSKQGKGQGIEWIKTCLSNQILNGTTATICSASDKKGFVYVVFNYYKVAYINNQTFTAVGTDFLIVKYNGAGDIQWVKEMKSALNNKSISTISVADNNDLLLTGIISHSDTTLFFDSTITGNGNFFYTARVSENGHLKWIVRGGGTAIASSNNLEIASAGNNASVAIGVSNVNSSFGGLTSSNTFLVFQDSNGLVKWIINYPSSFSSNDLYLRGVTANKNNIIVYGHYKIAKTLGAFSLPLAQGSTDAFWAMLDTTGQYTDVQRIQGNVTDYIQKINLHRDGSFITFTQSSSDTIIYKSQQTIVPLKNKSKVLISRYTAYGTNLWNRYALGRKGSIFTTRYGSMSSDNQSHYFGGYLTSGVQTTDSFEFSGTYKTIPVTTSGFIFYLTKLDSNGNFIWLVSGKQPGGSALNAQNQAHCVDTSGSVYWGATFKDSLEIYQSVTLKSLGTYNGFFVKIRGRIVECDTLAKQVLCTGDSLLIPYRKYDTFDPGNIFTVQLSDSAGNFTNPSSIGSIVSTQSDTFHAFIPTNLPPGTGYKIRATSSSPPITGSPSPKTYTIYPRTKADAGKDTTVCNGTLVQLQSSGGNKGTWSPGKLFSDAQSYSPIFTPPLNTSASFESHYLSFISSYNKECTDTANIVVKVRPAISAQPTSQLLACINRNVILKAGARGGDSSYFYQWFKLPDTTAVVGNDSVLLVNANTSKDYRCRITDGCTVAPFTSDTIKVRLRPILQVGVGFPLNPVLIHGQSFSRKVILYPPPIYPYHLQWYFRGKPISNADSVAFTPDSTGELKVVMYDSCALLTDSAATTIFVKQQLLLLKLNDTVICKGGKVPITLTAIGPDTSIMKFSWSHGLGLGKTKLLTPDTTTRYSILLSDGFNLPDTSYITVTVKPPLALTEVSDTTLCAEDSTLISVTPSGGNGNYQVVWNDGFTGNKRMLVADPLKLISYRITLKDGCSPPVSRAFDLIAEPLPQINLGASPKIGCPPLVVKAKNLNGNDPQFGYTYTWSLGNGQKVISDLDSLAYLYQKAGQFNLTLAMKSARGCKTKPDSVLITVHPAPIAQFITDQNLVYFTDTTRIRFTNTSQQATDIFWDLGDGRKDKNINTITHVYADTGVYQASLIARNTFGCLDTFSQNIVLKPMLEIWLPNAFTPDADHLNNTFYPIGDGIKHYRLIIYDRWGAVVYRSNLAREQWNGGFGNDINNQAPEGVYPYEATVFSTEGQRFIYSGIVHLIR